jgi:multidrug efflux pump subunit AcrA (membrane-fusion protein)
MGKPKKKAPAGLDPEGLLERIERLSDSGPDAAEYWSLVLAAKCALGQADAAALLRYDRQGAVEVVMIQPEVEKTAGPPAWLRQCAEMIKQEHPIEKRLIRPLAGSETAGQEDSAGSVVVIPRIAVSTSTGYEVFLLQSSDPRSLRDNCRTLELVDSFCDLLQGWSPGQPANEGLERLKQSMQVLSAVNRQDNFQSAAMAFCSEIASRWRCERASSGFIEGRYVKLKAMSHTESFVRKMQLVQDIESAMEECVDQDMEVLHPAPEHWPHVNRAAGNLSKRYGPTSVLSLPLRKAEKVHGAVTLERPPERPFSPGEIETLRLVCELCTARLADLYRSRLGAAAAVRHGWRSLRDALAAPRHTAVKAAAAAVLVGLVFIIFGKGIYKAEAPFVIEAAVQQVVPAPFDGFIKDVAVEVDDTVEGGETVLAFLDTAELRLQLAQAAADKAAYLKQAAAAMRDGETAQAQIAQANADKADAQARLLKYRIGQAGLTSPITGTVVKGDLKKQVGLPVQTGDVLFEVAPLESLRAELMVPEDRIFDVEVGQEGYLATFSYPSKHIEFEVERINPVAEVVNQRNVFKVRVRLVKPPDWMRPGMEGVAKIHAGRRPFIWIWTRKVVNWIRMKLWI